jgi:hypothetical protein
VVVIQNDLLSALPTRLAVPLAVLDTCSKVPKLLCLAITVQGPRLPRVPFCQEFRATLKKFLAAPAALTSTNARPRFRRRG